MENLPCEITSEILSRVDAGSILPAKQVCKTWRALLDHVKIGLVFIKKGEVFRILYTSFDKLINSTSTNVRTNLSIGSSGNTILFEEIKPPTEVCKPYPWDPLVGSCNGLLCVSLSTHYNRITHNGLPDHILNPVTGEYVKLPGLDPTADEVYAAGGFGYLHTTNEYKIVRMLMKYMGGGQFSLKVEVYTLGSGCGWRVKGYIPCTLRSSGVLADGALHWLDNEKLRIVSFDLRDEEFRVVLLPPPLFPTPGGKLTTVPGYSRASSFKLKVLRGCLCLVVQRKPRDCLEIWLLKKNYYTGENGKQFFWGWCMEFSIECDEPYRHYDLIALTKNDEVLLRCDSRVLCRYDLKTKILGKLWEAGDRFSLCPFRSVLLHMKTSISLKDLGEKSKSFHMMPFPISISISPKDPGEKSFNTIPT